MKERNRRVSALIFSAALTTTATSMAQARSTASVRSPLSAFVQGDYTFTGLGGSGLGNSNVGLGGRNISFTVGLDLTFWNPGAFVIAAEVRGSYPLYRGKVDGQKSALAGLRVDRAFYRDGHSRFRLSLNALAGRGEFNYVNGGYKTVGYLYSSSDTAVYAVGTGFELPISKHLSYKAEADVQRWLTPVTNTHVVIAKAGSLGLVYSFTNSRAR